MNTRLKNLMLLTALLCGLSPLWSRRVNAQTFATLQSFTLTNGLNPVASLILSGNVLYGTTKYGGVSGYSQGAGTVFRINADGTGFTNLHNFTGGDGYGPSGSLIMSGDTLFGTTSEGGGGGNWARGTVFGIKTDGSDFTNLYTFTGSDGSYPYGGLALLGNTLYGTTAGPGPPAGSYDDGTVFGVNTDGTEFTNLFTFSGSEGYHPLAGLILSSNIFYGAASLGGTFGSGALFKLNVDGTGFTNLYNFTALSGGNPRTNGDGASPQSSLIISGDTLYGTTPLGGGSGSGTVFAVNTDGSGFRIVYDFPATAGGNSTNNDGASPFGSLILSGNTLYGTAYLGGSFGFGTVFSVDTNGASFAVLHTFTLLDGPGAGDLSNSDGASPLGGLILSGNILYGTADVGGSFNSGTIFSISLPPQLSIAASGPNVILNWPTNVAGLSLQSTPSLTAPALWTPVYPGPVVINGLNTVTNPMTSAQQFYRLSQ